MAEPGFFGRTLQAGARALRANLPLALLCAVVLALIQHFQMRAQITMLSAALEAGPGGAGAVFEAQGGKMIGFSILQGAIYMFLYVALLFGAHAAILYRPQGEISPGFAHFAHAPGSLMRFFWRLVVIGFRIFLIVLPVVLVLSFAAGGVLGGGNVAGALSLGAALVMIALLVGLYASARYGLALPAAVADDADLSIAAAVERVRPRFRDLLFALLVFTFGPFLAQLGVEAAFRSVSPSFLAASSPAPGPLNAAFFQSTLESLQALRADPAFWIYILVTASLGLVSAIYAAAALSVGYRDAAEEGLARPGARL